MKNGLEGRRVEEEQPVMKVLQERPKGRWCVLERWWLIWREGDSATCKTDVKCKEKERQLGSEALEPQTYNYN